MKKLQIENCDYRFEFKCPLEWKNLERTKDSSIKFCNECNKKVYKCSNKKDIVKHTKLRDCIVINKPNMPMGMISPPIDRDDYFLVNREDINFKKKESKDN